MPVRVSPDPCTGKNLSRQVDLDPLNEVSSPAAWSEQNEATEPSILEKAGFKSLRLIKQALDILAAPPEEEPPEGSRWEHDRNALTASSVELAQAASR